MWILIKYDRRSDSESIDELFASDTGLLQHIRGLQDARLVHTEIPAKIHKKMHPMAVMPAHDFYVVWMNPADKS